MPLLDNFRENMRRGMETKAVSQRELSRISGIHWVTISRILSGTVEPSVTVCETLAKAIDQTPEKIFQKFSPSGRKTA